MRSKRKYPKIGDLVKPAKNIPEAELFADHGIIIDSLELEGYDNFEVLFDDGHRGWFSDLEIEVLYES